MKMFAGVIMTALAAFGSLFMSGCYHGGSPEKKAEFVLGHLDDMAEDLKLDEAQMVKFKEIRQKVQTTIMEGIQKRKAGTLEVKAELDKEHPDMEKAAEIAKKNLNQFPERFGNHIDLFVEFYNILNEDQKAVVLKKMRRIMNRHMG